MKTAQIPLEYLDFVVDSKNRKLIPNPEHGDKQMSEEYGDVCSAPLTPAVVEDQGRTPCLTSVSRNPLLTTVIQ